MHYYVQRVAPSRYVSWLKICLCLKNALFRDFTCSPAVKKFSCLSCPTLCDPMDCNTPGLPVHHQLPELAQTHVHQVADTIQTSRPLSSPSPPALNLFQHQGLFYWVSSSHQETKYRSFSFSISSSNEHPGLISFRMDWLDLLETLISKARKKLLISYFCISVPYDEKDYFFFPVSFWKSCRSS